jgi:cellulose synthase/poly-beta-1,6-N-acetylglucosamine synthase-like glycosyltransferase
LSFAQLFPEKGKIYRYFRSQKLKLILVLLILSLGAIALYSNNLRNSVSQAPQLSATNDEISQAQEKLASISVIIPAYNERENIEDCVTSVLNSTNLPATQLEVCVVDDQSTDETLTLVKSLQEKLADPRLKILAGKPRPTNQVWVGKNWACTQAVEQAKGEFLLFIDADLRLKPGAIEAALEEQNREETDLLSLTPALVCGCLAEWLIQPLIFSHLAVCFDFAAVNNPKSDAAFAAGMFMLFRRTAYEKLGGHQAVAGEVVEDVELARRVKAAGLKLRYMLGSNFVSARMYQSWNAIWEGWTKNLYLGANRRWELMVYMAVIMLLVYCVPWLGLMVFSYKFLANTLGIQDFLVLVLSCAGILLQYDLRRLGSKLYQLSLEYWWLSGLGGLLLAAIALGSVIKTETGWGWTWRGRVLTLETPE